MDRKPKLYPGTNVELTLLEHLFELLTGEVFDDLLALQVRLKELTTRTLEPTSYKYEQEMIDCVLGRFLGEGVGYLKARIWKLLCEVATECKEEFKPRFYDLGDFLDDMAKEIDELQYLEPRVEVGKHLVAAAEFANQDVIDRLDQRIKEGIPLTLLRCATEP